MLVLPTFCWLPSQVTKILASHLFQVSILQEELEAKDLEVARLKEMLSQKEATRDTAVEEERDEAANDINTASDPMEVRVES